MTDDSTTAPDGTPGFTITRMLDAPRSRVWHMWTDPDELAGWFNAAGIVTPRESVEVDVRVGGSIRYTMVDEKSGDTYPTGGVYLEVDPEERLSFTWGDPSDVFSDEGGDVVVTVTLTERGDRTELVFELRGLAGRPGDDSFYDGWVQALDGLQKVAGGAR